MIVEVDCRSCFTVPKLRETNFAEIYSKPSKGFKPLEGCLLKQPIKKPCETNHRVFIVLDLSSRPLANFPHFEEN